MKSDMVCSIQDKSAQSVYVSIGDHNKNSKDFNEEIIQASQIFIHENFRVSNLENDIGNNISL